MELKRKEKMKLLFPFQTWRGRFPGDERLSTPHTPSYFSQNQGLELTDNDGFGQWTTALKNRFGDSANEALVTSCKDCSYSEWSLLLYKKLGIRNQKPGLCLWLLLLFEQITIPLELGFLNYKTKEFGRDGPSSLSKAWIPNWIFSPRTWWVGWELQRTPE